MDYAIQLLVIIGLFLFGGLWMHDNWGLPMWGVIAMFFLGFTCAMVVLYQRSMAEAKSNESNYPKLAPLPEDETDSNDTENE